jgi:ubiquinone/menaquinone biosynthesis C-methylase UbiE
MGNSSAVSDSATRFTNKADNYARYRWDFSSHAIEAIFRISGLTMSATVADVGSGTGILSQHFVERVKKLFALEPNNEMRKLAQNLLGSYPAYTSIDGYAEATTLPNHSIDLIVVGRAIHWFDHEKARAEFVRILIPEGWLAILQTPCIDKKLDAAVKQIRIKENGWDVEGDKNKLKKTPLSFFFGSEDFILWISRNHF